MRVLLHRRRTGCGRVDSATSRSSVCFGKRKLAELCREHGISEPTYYRWKSKYSGMEVSDAKKLRSLEDENRKLKQLVAEQQLDNQALKAALGKKW